MLGMAVHPASADKGVGRTRVEGIVANRNGLALDFRVAKQVRPVEQVMDLNALARHDFGCTSGCGRQSGDEELSVVRDSTVYARSGFSTPRSNAARGL